MVDMTPNQKINKIGDYEYRCDPAKDYLPNANVVLEQDVNNIIGIATIREEQLRTIHKMELDAVSLMDFMDFKEWSLNRQREAAKLK